MPRVVVIASPHVPDGAPVGAREPFRAHWLGRVPYRQAWDLQRRLAAARATDAIQDQLLLLEHPAVLTLGRQADPSHVRASAVALRERGIEVIRVERGGEVTYHGPGQLVAYPILRLDRRGLLLRPLVRALEGALADTCAELGVAAGPREGHPGCWCEPDGARPRKIGALGLRVERGVTYHGIALNVDVDLADFELIDPCGEPETVSTSVAAEGGRIGRTAGDDAVARAASAVAAAFARRLGTVPAGDLAVPTVQALASLDALAGTA